jgi:hypothetical protein
VTYFHIINTLKVSTSRVGSLPCCKYYTRLERLAWDTLAYLASSTVTARKVFNIDIRHLPEWSPLCDSTIWVGSYPFLQVLDKAGGDCSDKHSKLILYGINCDRKKFYNIGTRCHEIRVGPISFICCRNNHLSLGIYYKTFLPCPWANPIKLYGFS